MKVTLYTYLVEDTGIKHHFSYTVDEPDEHLPIERKSVLCRAMAIEMQIMFPITLRMAKLFIDGKYDGTMELYNAETT